MGFSEILFTHFWACYCFYSIHDKSLLLKAIINSIKKGRTSIRILFCLPGYAKDPTGGFKIIYEYANRLAINHEVTVAHPDILLTGARAGEIPVRMGGFLVRRLHASYGPGAWFSFHPKVRVLTTPTLSSNFMPDADIVVATSWNTAEWVAKYPKPKGHKIYWVQDYEHIMTAPTKFRERIFKTYTDTFKIVAISAALRDLLADRGIPSTFIPNAIDHYVYSIQRAVNAPTRVSIGFPYRRESYKGTHDVLLALMKAKQRMEISESVWAFGADPHPNLPSWVEYHPRVSDGHLAQLYNQTKIFVVGSHFEGWGLPGLEAMACGATLVSTQTGGVSAYAVHEVNALLSPPHHPDLLAANILRLLAADEERQSLAIAGMQSTRQYRWDTSVEKTVALFEDVLKGSYHA